MRTIAEQGHDVIGIDQVILTVGPDLGQISVVRLS